MDSIPKAIADLIAADPNGEVEIVLRRAPRSTPDAAAAGVPAEGAPAAAGPIGAPGAEPEEAADAPAVSALQASINRGKAAPRAPTSYSMPRRAK